MGATKRGSSKKAPQLASTVINDLFSVLDTNGENEIFFSDFLAATMEVQKNLRDESLQKIFHRLDNDGSGSISTRDLQSALGEGVLHGNKQAILEDFDGAGFAFREHVVSGSRRCDFRFHCLVWPGLLQGMSVEFVRFRSEHPLGCKLQRVSPRQGPVHALETSSRSQARSKHARRTHVSFPGSGQFKQQLESSQSVTLRSKYQQETSCIADASLTCDGQ